MKTKRDTGKILQKARLENTVDVGRSLAGKLPASKIRHVEVELLVDTGAAMLCLTPKVIEQLGLHKSHERDVITGNGLMKRRVFEPVRI